MESYRTEEEQVEALRRWWDENGRSVVVAIVVALAAGFGWKSWQDYSQQQQFGASDIYQELLENSGQVAPTAEQLALSNTLAGQLKTEYASSTYAQFAALQLAKLAVQEGNLVEAEAQLRWVLKKADKTGDTAQVAQLRLARVLAAKGDSEQALKVLNAAAPSSYQATYALARGDILLAQGRTAEARDAYSEAKLTAAQSASQVSLSLLDQKLESLAPVPARELIPAVAEEMSTSTPIETAAAEDVVENYEE